MTTVFFLNGNDNSRMFLSLNGMAQWLIQQKPINNKFHTLNGDFDITAYNLAKVMAESERDGLCAEIRIEQDFFIQNIETKYILSSVEAYD